MSNKIFESRMPQIMHSVFIDATEKMDAILCSNTAWERLADSDTDDMKVTECADAFLTLLTTISDRYKHLPQPGHR